jgi:hypothetical protein
VTLAILAVGMALSALALLYIGRGQTIRGDPLGYAARLATEPLGHAMLYPPGGKYLIAPALLLYDGMFEAFGLAADLPYRIVSTALILLCGGLFFVLARRRVGDLLALPPTFLLLFFGGGWEPVLTDIRIPSLVAVASGLGTLIALERRDRLGDIGATIMLTISVSSHPTGLAFLAASVILVAARPSPQRWLTAWVPAIPAAWFAAWWFFLKLPGTKAIFPTHPTDVVHFVVDSWTTLVATVSGLAGVISHPVFDQAVTQLAAAVLAAAIVVAVVLRFRQVPPSLWAALAALIVLLASTRLAPAGFLRTPDAARYLYPEGVLFLLLITEVAAVVELRRWGAAAATLILALGLVYNLDKLRDAGPIVRANSEAAVGAYTAYEIVGNRVRASYKPDVIGPTAGAYLAAAKAYGSAAVSQAELADGPLVMRQAADRALVGSLAIRLDPDPSRVSVDSRAPHLDRVIAGRAVRDTGCVRMVPPEADGPEQTLVAVDPSPSPNRILKAAIRNEPVKPVHRVPELAELSLRGGELLIRSSNKISRIAVLLGQFALPPSAQLDQVYGSRQATLRLPTGGLTRPWAVTIAASDPVTVCAAQNASGT